MRYSRFNEHLGTYEVYEDARTNALNADLPVPKLPAVANGIGVAARNAGRSLPPGVRRVGESWYPVGLVVASAPLGNGMGDLRSTVKAHPVLAVVGVATVGAALYVGWKAYLRSMEAPWEKV